MRVGVALLLLVFFVVPVGQIEPVVAQIEHAPTPEQCRADADAWGIPTATPLFRNEAQFDQLVAATAGDKNVSAKMLDARMKQLATCIRTDNVQDTRYSEAARAYAFASMIRMVNFLNRHNLTPQFLEEDEKGQR